MTSNGYRHASSDLSFSYSTKNNFLHIQLDLPRVSEKQVDEIHTC